jgi:hypothetical protein
MITWQVAWMQQEHYQELLREAETERLVRRAWMASPRYHRLRRRARIWLGQQLVAWGQRLQCQSGAPTPTAGLQAARITC